MDESSNNTEQISRSSLTSPQHLKWLILLVIFACITGTISYLIASKFFPIEQTQPIQDYTYRSQAIPEPTPPPSYTKIPFPTIENSRQLPEEIQNTLIVFENDSKTYLLTIFKNELIELQGRGASLTNDKSKVAYAKMDEDNSIYIFDTISMETESFPTEAWRLTSVDWSPDGKHLVTDSGSSINRGGDIYAYPSGERVGPQFGFSSNIMWLDDDSFIFDESQDFFQPGQDRPWEAGLWTGIAKIVLSSRTKEVLKQATPLSDFRISKVNDGKIYYTENSVKSGEEWSDFSKHTVTYWKMDFQGEGDSRVENQKTLDEIIRDALPSNLSGRRVYLSDSHNTYPQWVIFTLDAEDSTIYSDLYVLNLDNPQSTLTSLGQGAFAQW